MPKALIRTFVSTIAVVLIAPALFLIALVGRFANTKKIDVGLGPHPLINNIYHARALAKYGFSAETFVLHTYFITSSFDIDLGKRLQFLPKSLHRALFSIVMLVVCLFRYKCLYLYFNGGPLALMPGPLWRIEGHLLKLAGVKIVVMPYGGDVQDMSRSRNLYFKHTMTESYPQYHLTRSRVIAQLDYWTRHADFVFSGVEWVDYQYHWDKLMLGHFSIDVAALPGKPYQIDETLPLKVLHAPNHRSIKGTQFIIDAIIELQAEGEAIELTLIEKQPNEAVLQAILQADIVVDQLVIGWYAMFAIETMALGRPCICYTRPDLIELYTKAGLLGPDEMPLIQADTLSIKEVLKHCIHNRADLIARGERGAAFVGTHHSIDSIGKVFSEANEEIGLQSTLS